MTRARHSIASALLAFALVLSPLIASAEAPDPDAKEVVYGATSAGELRGFVYLPAGTGPFPAVLWNHGSEQKPGWQSALGHFYSSKGYVFFVPHRHGHGRSPGEYVGDQQKGKSGAETVALHELYNRDVEQAAAWLSRQAYVDTKRMVMSGLSYGGIQTVLSAEKGLGMRAFIAFAPGAMSWSRVPELGPRLARSIRNARAPIFLLQAKNDFSLGPSEVLGPEVERKGPPSQARVYPPVGTEPIDGHAAFATRADGIALWGSDVLAFIAKATAPAAPGSAAPQPPSPVAAGTLPNQASVETAVRSLIHNTQIPIAIGLINAAGRVVYGFGPSAPDGNTVFEIGSVSKVFTGLLLAQAVQRGEARLDDLVASYLPRNVHLPQAGAPMTLLHLATHTSGLPRMSPGAKQAKKAQRPYTIDEFYSYLPTAPITAAPGASYLYSNIGAGLLGHLLAARAGLPSFRELLAARITRPLGMNDTFVEWSQATWSRAARPSGGGGAPNGYVLLDGGAGGVKSTPNDLLKLEAAYLGLQSTGFGPALALATTPRFKRDGDDAVGLLWNLDLKNGLVAKDGKVNGYLGFLMFSPSHRSGVVICTTVGIGTRLKLVARKLLALLEGQAATQAAETGGADDEPPDDSE